MTASASYIIATCWCIFVVVWLAGAIRTKRTAEKQSVESALAHRIPVAFGWWLLIVPNLPGRMNLPIIPHTTGVEITGAAICLFGLFFTVWARFTLAGNWSGNVTFKRDHELIRTGPYHFVRHPIYTGLLIMFAGTAIAIGQLRGAISLLSIAIGFWIKLNQEERLLVRHFPDDYPAYKREVKALVPFVI